MKRLEAKQIEIKIGNKKICQQLNLTLNAGEIWGVLGPNGCGKTTLLHALTGLHPLQQGEIYCHGEKLKNLSTKVIAQSIGLLFQDFNASFPQTVWEYCLESRFPHLNYFKKATEQDKKMVWHALQMTELNELSHRVITKLSGGEKRRLALSALLAQTPTIFLLDEPSNHLDIKHQMNIFTYLQKLAKTDRVSIMMSLHDIHLAKQFCSHLLLLFADGSTKQGETKQIMTIENLTTLYHYPMEKFYGYQNFS